jgi:hypothetical protein
MAETQTYDITETLANFKYSPELMLLRKMFEFFEVLFVFVKRSAQSGFIA